MTAARGLGAVLGATTMSFLTPFLLVLGGACRAERGLPAGGSNGHLAARDELETARLRMVAEQIEGRGIRNLAVLDAMRKVPRHLFVPEMMRPHAYDDAPLPIGEGQTISQPYIVAIMSDLLGAGRGSRVLEIGTGSGYQAAVLAEMGAEVFTIEIVESLAAGAKERLARLGYGSVRCRAGDGYRGWPEEAPFDAVIVTAAPDHLPRPLVDQLRVGGRLVIPVGKGEQDLWVVTRTEEGTIREDKIPVRFVPMTGEAQRRHD